MIKKYSCKQLIAEGYERWVRLEHDELKTTIWAHYIAEDYIEPNHSLILDKYIEGEISIDLVGNYEEVYNTGFEQPISNSSHIVAYTNVIDVLDNFSALCKIDGFPDPVRVRHPLASIQAAARAHAVVPLCPLNPGYVFDSALKQMIKK